MGARLRLQQSALPNQARLPIWRVHSASCELLLILQTDYMFTSVSTHFTRKGAVMTRVAFLAVASGLLSLTAISANAENLLLNGSFEQGPPVPYMTWGSRTGYLFTTLHAANTDITGWVVKPPDYYPSGDIDYVREYWRASDGVLSIDLCGFAAGGIAQTFATVVGQAYAVTFDIAMNPTVQGLTRTIEVSAAGQFRQFSRDNTGHTYDEMGWETKTWLFTADSSSTELWFKTVFPASDAEGMALDNVRLVVVPESATLTLCVTAGCLLVQRRTKQPRRGA